MPPAPGFFTRLFSSAGEEAAVAARLAEHELANPRRGGYVGFKTISSAFKGLGKAMGLGGSFDINLTEAAGLSRVASGRYPGKTRDVFHEARSLGKIHFGGGIRRTVAGTAIGGIAGLAVTDENTGTGKAKAFMKGAVVGAGVGLATTGVALSGYKAAGRSVKTGVQNLAAREATRVIEEGRPLYGLYLRGQPGLAIAHNMARRAGAVAGRAGSMGAWVLNNPRKAAALAGVGIGGIALMHSGGGTRGDLDVMSRIATNTGVSSTGYDPGFGGDYQQQVHQMFMESTYGLTQGLHRGRHR